MAELYKSAGAAEVERQQLKEQLEQVGKDAAPPLDGAAHRGGGGGGDPSRRPPPVGGRARRRCGGSPTCGGRTRCSRSARSRTEQALRQLQEVQTRNGELEREVSRLGATAQSQAELQAASATAEVRRATAEAALDEAKRQLDGKATMLRETEQKLRLANDEIARSDKLLKEALGAKGSAAASESLEKVYAEADRRVKEVRKVAEEQLREERKRSSEDLKKAEASAKQVQAELQRQLAEARKKASAAEAATGGTTLAIASGALEQEVVELRRRLSLREEELVALSSHRRVTEERLLGTVEAADYERHAEAGAASQLRADNQMLVSEVARLREELAGARSGGGAAGDEAAMLREKLLRAEADLRATRKEFADATERAARAEGEANHIIHELEASAAMGAGGAAAAMAAAEGDAVALRRENDALRHEVERAREEAAFLGNENRRLVDLGVGGGGGGGAIGAPEDAHRLEVAAREVERLTDELERSRAEARRAADFSSEAAEGELGALRRELAEAQQRLHDEVRRADAAEAELRRVSMARAESGPQASRLEEELRSAHMQNDALNVDIRRADQKYRHELNALKQHYEDKLYQLRNALIDSEESRSGGGAQRARRCASARAVASLRRPTARRRRRRRRRARGGGRLRRAGRRRRRPRSACSPSRSIGRAASRAPTSSRARATRTSSCAAAARTRRRP